MEKESKKLCKHCKTEIPADAKVCPNCRKKQGIKLWQIILIGIAIIVVIGAVAGGGSDEATSNEQDVKKETKTQEKQEEKKEFTQNETVTFKNIDFTVTNVEKTTGSEYDTAKEGYEYVIVSIKIENKSEEKISYNPYDWKMENSNGQEEDITFTTIDSDTALSSGNLNAGGIVEGTLAFEQPQGDGGLKLNYYNNSVFDEEASFKIKLD
ncbi:MAG: DUF4352 domain-containing protein [Lachnospiraceae bacterium]